MIIAKTVYSRDDGYYRCDQCGKITPGRYVKNEQGEGFRPPLGWVAPRRVGQMFNPAVNPENFCGFSCLQEHDGMAPATAENVPEAEQQPAPEPPELVRAGSLAEVRSLDEALHGPAR